MQKMFITVVLSVLLVLLSGTASYSQLRVSVGPNVGLNFNIHSVEYSGQSINNTPTGFGMLAGAQVELMFSRGFGLLANLQFYDNRHASFDYNYRTSLPRANVFNVIENYPVLITGPGNFSLAYFQIETLAKFLIPGGLFFTLGPAIGFNTSGSEDWDLKYDFSPQVNRETSKGVYELKETKTRFEIKGGIGFDIPIGSGMAIAPHLGFAYGFTDVNTERSRKWKIMTVQGMVTYKFRLTDY